MAIPLIFIDCLIWHVTLTENKGINYSLFHDPVVVFNELFTNDLSSLAIEKISGSHFKSFLD